MVAVINGCGSPLHFTKQADETTASKRLLFVSNQDGNREIYTANMDGSQLRRLTRNTWDDYDASWSPDGKSILFTSTRDNGNSEVYVMQADGKGQTNLSQWQGYDGQPTWSPDGQYLVFVSDRSGTMQVYALKADGSGLRQLTDDPSQSCDSPAFSPNGQLLAYRKLNEQAKGDLWLLDMRSHTHRQLTDNPKHEDGQPRWSPDGKSLVYHSRRNKEYNIYRFDIPTFVERPLTKLPSSDADPVWSQSGEYIAFLSTRGPFGRTQLFVMKEDGSNQRSITDGISQVAFPAWIDGDARMLLVSWRGNRNSNVYVVDLKTQQLTPVAPAEGYQSQPRAEPVLLPQSKSQSRGHFASNALLLEEKP